MKTILPDMRSVPAPESLTQEEQVALLTISKQIQDYFSSLEAYVSQQMQQGVKYPGWKLVQGRSTRKWADETKAAAAIEASGIDKAILFSQVFVSPAQAEKIVGKKSFAHIAGDYVVMSVGSPSVAPDSDPRPEYVPESKQSAINDFEEEIRK